MKNGRMFQDFHPIHCSAVAACEDMFDGDPASDVISMADYGSVIFFIVCNAGATGTATITVESCDDVTPSVSTAVAFKYWACTTPDVWSDMGSATTSGFATTAGATAMYAIEISAEALSGTDSFVRLQCTELVNSPVDGNFMAIAGRGRYVHEVQATALA